MNGDFCPYFFFQTQVANAWVHRFAGQFICLNIQPTILQPVQEVSVSHQNALVFFDVTITSDVQQKPAVRKLSLKSTDLKFRFLIPVGHPTSFSVLLFELDFLLTCFETVFTRTEMQTQWRLVTRGEGCNFLSVG